MLKKYEFIANSSQEFITLINRQYKSETNKGTTVHIKIPYDNHPKPNTGSE